MYLFLGLFLLQVLFVCLFFVLFLFWKGKKEFLKNIFCLTAQKSIDKAYFCPNCDQTLIIVVVVLELRKLSFKSVLSKLHTLYI